MLVSAPPEPDPRGNISFGCLRVVFAIIGPMQLPITSLHQVGATAFGVDKSGRPAQVDLIAYVMDAGDVNVAIAVVEAQVLNEDVIPDGSGGFTRPQRVTAMSVSTIGVLPVAYRMYRHTGPSADEKFPVNSIYEVQVQATLNFEGPFTKTLSVYPLNTALSPSLALAVNDVLNMPIFQDPEDQNKMDKPDTVVALSANPVTNAPISSPILVASVVIPDWPDAETVDRGGGRLPSAQALGLKTSFGIVPNDGSHSPGDVISLTPPAGSTVRVGSVVVVVIWGQSE